MPGGRPSEFNWTIAKLILDEIAKKTSVNKTAEIVGITPTTIFRWLAANQEFSECYARAKEMACELIADEMIEIADDGTNDWYEKNGRKAVDYEAVMRSKLRVDTRKWLLAKLMPKKYGDRLEIEGGYTGQPLLQINVIGADGVPKSLTEGLSEVPKAAESRRLLPAEDEREAVKAKKRGKGRKVK
jgi:hypothetical protein